jgi:hypothetical protein
MQLAALVLLGQFSAGTRFQLAACGIHDSAPLPLSSCVGLAVGQSSDPHAVCHFMVSGVPGISIRNYI